MRKINYDKENNNTSVLQQPNNKTDAKLTNLSSWVCRVAACMSAQRETIMFATVSCIVAVFK